jgi:hypothetical protein
MRIRVLTTISAAIAVIALPGCGAGSTTGQTSHAPSASPIPPVKNPRDVAAMARRPCELLTAQQARGFGLNLPPEQSDGLFGTLDCKWTTTTRDRRIIRTVDLSMFTNNPTLEVAYTKDRGLPYFELTEITGYPAIVTRTNAELPSCDIDIKPAERQSVSIIYDSEQFRNNPQQACEVGKQVAAAIIMNLPPKG